MAQTITSNQLFSATGTGVDLNTTVSAQFALTFTTGDAPQAPPATPDDGDLHQEIYVNGRVFWTYDGAVWANELFVPSSDDVLSKDIAVYGVPGTPVSTPFAIGSTGAGAGLASDGGVVPTFTPTENIVITDMDISINNTLGIPTARFFEIRTGGVTGSIVVTTVSMSLAASTLTTANVAFQSPASFEFLAGVEYFVTMNFPNAGLLFQTGSDDIPEFALSNASALDGKFVLNGTNLVAPTTQYNVSFLTDGTTETYEAVDQSDHTTIITGDMPLPVDWVLVPVASVEYVYERLAHVVTGTLDLDVVIQAKSYVMTADGSATVLNGPAHGFNPLQTMTQVKYTSGDSALYGILELTVADATDIKRYLRRVSNGFWGVWEEVTGSAEQVATLNDAEPDYIFGLDAYPFGAMVSVYADSGTDNRQYLISNNPAGISEIKEIASDGTITSTIPGSSPTTIALKLETTYVTWRSADEILFIKEVATGGEDGLRGAPVADNAALTALTARNYEKRKVAATGVEWIFELGKTPAGNDLADDGATGAWVKIEVYGAVASDEIGTLKQVPNVDETGAAMTNAAYVAKGLLPLVNGYTLTDGATDNPKFALMFPTFVSGNDLVVPSTFSGDFVRNLGGNAGAFMALQADQIASHNHSSGVPVFGAEAGFGTSTAGGGNGGVANWTSTGNTNKALTSSTGGSETRPDNFAMQFCLVLDSYSRVLMVNVGDIPVDDQAASGYIDIGTMRMQWGTVNHGSPSGATQVVVFPQPFGSTPNIVSTPQTGNNTTSASAISATQFTSENYLFNASDGTAMVSWQAIGTKP